MKKNNVHNEASFLEKAFFAVLIFLLGSMFNPRTAFMIVVLIAAILVIIVIIVTVVVWIISIFSKKD